MTLVLSVTERRGYCTRRPDSRIDERLLLPLPQSPPPPPLPWGQERQGRGHRQGRGVTERGRGISLQSRGDTRRVGTRELMQGQGAGRQIQSQRSWVLSHEKALPIPQWTLVFFYCCYCFIFGSCLVVLRAYSRLCGQSTPGRAQGKICSAEINHSTITYKASSALPNVIFWAPNGLWSYGHTWADKLHFQFARFLILFECQ